MKQKRLLQRLLFPALPILITFPIIACVVFHYTAGQYAVRKAENELAQIQELMMPYVDEAFSAESELTPKERVALFVRNAAPAVRRTDEMTGSGRILLFAGNYKIVYPREEEDREAVEPLAAACRKYIQESERDTLNETTKLITEDGREYLTRILKVPNDTREIKYLISYCPVSDIGAWVGAATLRVLAISFAAAFIIIILLIYTAKNVNKSLSRLCDETEKIGKGSFTGIDYSFGITELEQLRVSMNQMSRRLKEAEESKNKFYQNISHDLRTPLMSIAGYAQGIETGVFDDPMHAVHIISEESMRLTGLVEGLLNLSRINVTEKPKLVRLSLSEELSDICEHMNGMAVSLGKVIKLDIDEEADAVLGDSDSLWKITENILSNALRYAKKEVCIEARSVCDEQTVADHGINGSPDIETKDVINEQNNSANESSQYVMIQIIDDGNGIKESELPYIFERHYKGEGGGFGFGLAIAQAAAHNIGAKLSAENVKDKGACFTIVLRKLPSSDTLKGVYDDRSFVQS